MSQGVCVEERTLAWRYIEGNLQDQSPAEERQLRVSHTEGAYLENPGCPQLQGVDLFFNILGI